MKPAGTESAGWREIAKRGDSDVVSRARELLTGVLEEHRHARSRAFEQRCHEEADVRVERLACGDAGVAQLGGRDLATRDQRALLDRAQPHQIVHRAHPL